MEIKHISLGVNSKTHNVNNETSNNKSAPFNNASVHVRAYILLWDCIFEQDSWKLKRKKKNKKRKNKGKRREKKFFPIPTP